VLFSSFALRQLLSILICQPDPRITQIRSRKVHQLEQEFEDDEISQGQIRKYFPETWIFAEGVVG